MDMNLTYIEFSGYPRCNIYTQRVELTGQTEGMQ